MIERIDAMAADIDMTLTNKGGDLPDVLKDVFQIMHRSHILLGLATGREITEKICRQGSRWGLPFEFDFIIGMNGGMIYDTATGRMWSTQLLSCEELRYILTVMKPLIDGYGISVNAEGGGNHNAMNINDHLRASAKRSGIAFVDKTGDIDGFCEKPAYKLLLRTDGGHEQEMRDVFMKNCSDKYQIFTSFPGTLEVMRKGIDKGSGMKRYAEEFGIELKNVIAFGDSENDNSLLKICGWGVCLANGSESTKSCADDVTEYGCENAGAGHYLIEHYLKPHGMI